MPEPVPGVLSVVIPTYNRAALLTRAVDSVLAGTQLPLEVVVVDDGSEDDTESTIAAIGDSRVRYMRVAHGGVSAARNAGASAATARWLAFLDSDDEVLPGWADAMVDAAERAGGIAVCGGVALDGSGRTLWTWTPAPVTHPPPQQLAEMFLPGMFLLDRRAFLDAGGYVEELAFGENTELALRLLYLAATPVSAVPRTLVRRHVATPRSHYSSSRISSARYVLDRHPWTRRRLPGLWASYNALLGVDAAKRRHWARARHHFLLAARARRSREHLLRLAVSAAPVVRTLAWPDADAGPEEGYGRPSP